MDERPGTNMFIDAHHHLWDLEKNPHYPWLLSPVEPSHIGDYTALQRSYHLNAFLADWSPMRPIASVHVEANWRRDDPVGETEWLQSVADEHGYPQAIVCHVDLAALDPLPVLEAQSRFANVRGVRRMTTKPGQALSSLRPGDNLLCDDRFSRNLKLLRRFGLSFDMQATTAVMQDAARLASAHPDVPIALTHAGLPIDRSAEGLALWRQGLREMAERPNVFVKLSGLAMLDPEWTPDSIVDTMRVVIDLFGPDRCMLGTNFPVDKLRANPSALLRACVNGLASFSPSERAAILGLTAARFYRVEVEMAPSPVS